MDKHMFILRKIYIWNLLCSLSALLAATGAERPNILFIIDIRALSYFPLIEKLM